MQSLKCFRILCVWMLGSGVMFTGLFDSGLFAQEQVGGIAAVEGTARTDLSGDPLPDGAMARLGTRRFRGYGFGRSDLAFLPENRGLLVRGYSGDIELWDIETGRLLRSFEATNASSYFHFRMFADGHRLLRLNANKFNKKTRQFTQHLEILNIDSGEVLKTIQWDEDINSQTRVLALSPTEKIAATGGMDGLVRFWNLETGNEITSFRRMERTIDCLSFSPDGESIAIGQGSSGSGLFNWKLGEGLVYFPEIRNSGISMKFTPDGKRLLINYRADAPMRSWNIQEGKWDPKYEIAGQIAKSSRFTLSPDGQRFYVKAYGADAVSMYDIDSMEKLKTYDTKLTAASTIAVSADERYLALKGSNSTVVVWDLNLGEKVNERFAGHYDQCDVLKFSKDARTLYSGGLDGQVKVWDVASGRLLASLDSGANVNDLKLSDDGRYLAGLGLAENGHVWDLKTNHLVCKLPGHGRTGHFSSIAIIFTEDGKSVVSVGPDLILRQTTISSGEVTRTVEIDPSDFNVKRDAQRRPILAAKKRFEQPREISGPALFSQDAKLLWLKVEGIIYTFDVSTGEEVEKYLPEMRIQSFSISGDDFTWGTVVDPDPNSGDPERKPEIWMLDAKTKAVLSQTKFPDIYVWRTTFSPDSQMFTARLYEKDGQIFGNSALGFFNTKTGRQVGVIDVGERAFGTIAFSSDSQFVAIGHGDSTITVWRVDDFLVPSFKSKTRKQK